MGRERRSTHGSQGYRYRWTRPIVRGVPPEGRLAHSAALVRVAEGEGGTTTGKQALMVVFGGVGTGALFNDVHILR